MVDPEDFAFRNTPGGAGSLRFGIMCGGMVFQAWQADALCQLEKSGHVPVLLIVDAREAPTASLVNRLLRKKWRTIVFNSLENRLFRPKAKFPVDLGAELRNIDRLDCLVEKRGFSEYFSPDDIASVKHHKLDFILRFGFNIIRGDILTAAHFGVWSFHHDDEMKYRGGPAGFWEIYRGDPVSGAVLQRLTDKLDGGIILQKGYLKTIRHSYRENLEQLLSVSASWPARVASLMAGNDDQKIREIAAVSQIQSNTHAGVFKVPGNGQMLKFLFLLAKNRFEFYIRDLIVAEIWNIGVIMRPINLVATGKVKLTAADINWLPHKIPSGYLADPSGFMEGDGLHILAEEYSYAEQKAVISELVWSPPSGEVRYPEGVTRPVSVISGERHFSYPFVFNHLGGIYCLPESFQSSEIYAYKRDPEAGGFVKFHKILDDIEAVDPTMVFYNGLLWLFFTEREYSNTHLSLYYADQLTGEFKPHPMNPVKTDIRSARPAGTPFLDDGVLFRPAQDCSVTYGGRVAVNKILRLTPDEFLEETVWFIEPAVGSKFSSGLHTLSGVGDYTLIDGKRYRFNHYFFMHQLRLKLGRKDRKDV